MYNALCRSNTCSRKHRGVLVRMFAPFYYFALCAHVRGARSVSIALGTMYTSKSVQRQRALSWRIWKKCTKFMFIFCFSEAIFIKLESSTKLRASNNPLLRARGFLAHSMTIITPSSNKTYIKLRKVQLLAGFWLSPSSSILLLLFGGGQGARRSRLVLCRHTCAVST